MNIGFAAYGPYFVQNEINYSLFMCPQINPKCHKSVILLSQVLRSGEKQEQILALQGRKSKSLVSADEHGFEFNSTR